MNKDYDPAYFDLAQRNIRELQDLVGRKAMGILLSLELILDHLGLKEVYVPPHTKLVSKKEKHQT